MELVDNALTPDIYNVLRKSVGWPEFSAAQAQSALKNRCLNVVAFAGKEPIAMGSMIGDGIYFLLVDVVVAPDYQGKGIGKEIVERLIQSVKNELSTDERCSIHLVSAQGKEGFYKKLGFTEIPDLKSGHGMRLSLKK